MSSPDWDKKYDIINGPTPHHTQLSGQFKRSFAYHTMRDRLPITITSIIDNLTRDKDELVGQYGEASREEIKNVIGKLSQLKYELQTDKYLKPFTANEPDRDIWNSFLSTLPKEKRTFFRTCWLYAECYMYRRIFSFFESTQTLKEYDCFAKQKQNALINSAQAMENIIKRISELDKTEATFVILLKLSLWSNRCDLSITSGKEVTPLQNLFDIINKLNENILIDDSLDIVNCLTKTENNRPKEPIVVELICDNAGFELFADFMLADYLIDKRLATKVSFNVKVLPWFVSDVTPKDFHWTLQWLSENQSTTLSDMGKRWTQFVKEGKFELAKLENFWTTPYEYYLMREVKPDLYKHIAKAKLVIFKGDLNYRKLLGDFNWGTTDQLTRCIRGFRPTNLCALRTIKADLICGLSDGVAQQLTKNDVNWMTTGEYGLIQFVERYNSED